LVEQAARHCERTYANITIASVQSIVSGDRLQNYDPQNFKLVLVDEAHHIVAERYLDVLEHFGLARQATEGTSAAPVHTALVGVSATLSRHDGLALGTAIDHIVYHKDYLDMMDAKWLTNATFTTVQSGADLSLVKGSKKDGDFRVSDLSRAVNNAEVNNVTVEAWAENAKGRKSTLVFCTDLSHVTSLTRMFRARGIDARFITSATHKKIRGDRLDEFKRGVFPVLLNCGVFTEGTDIPNIDCVLLARPTKSRNLLVQMIGRGLRLHPGKENCHVIDMVASLETGIVTTPTLFGLDPDTIIKNADEASMESVREKQKKEKAREQLADGAAEHPSSSSGRPMQVNFTHYDTISDLIEDTSGERFIRALSKLAWVQVDTDRYVLSNSNGEYIRIDRDPSLSSEDSYSINFIGKIPPYQEATARSPFARARLIGTSQTLEDAVHAADTFAGERFSYTYLRTSAGWRQAPATEAQIAFLNRTRTGGTKLIVANTTKGRATEMIAKLKFGAKGRFKKGKVEQRRQETKVEKRRAWEERVDREQVRVGPVPM